MVDVWWWDIGGGGGVVTGGGGGGRVGVMGDGERSGEQGLGEI